MRILYCHYLNDPTHPAVQMVESIASELRQRGHHVQVHASAGLADRVGDGSPQRRTRWQSLKNRAWFAKSLLRNVRRVAQDRQRIQEFQPDVILCRQDAYCYSVARAATQLGRPLVTYADAPVAYESRTYEANGRWHPPALVEAVERYGLLRSRAIITVSNPAASRLDRYQLAIPCHVVPNGVHADQYPRLTPQQKKGIRSSLGLDDSLVIGFQGSFKSFHGIDRLRDLIQWTSRKQGVQWLLVGDGPERDNLEAAVGDHPHVHFAGKRTQAEMPSLLSVMDIAIAPHSQLQGDFYFCPLKILEYAASGCAVIASAQGDIPGLLNDGRCGQIVKDDDLASWTAALELLLEHSGYREELGRDARDFALRHLTWRETATRVEQALSNVVLSTPDAPIHLLDPTTSYPT